MNTQKKCYQKYLPSPGIELAYLINCTTAGFQTVSKGDNYPVMNHPTDYNFVNRKGRILNEYQILYISEGKGTFTSKSLDKETEVFAGSFIILFPGEWHSYYPDEEIGWKEHWIGFKGAECEKIISTYGFSKSYPLLHIGMKTEILNLFQDVCSLAESERTAMQSYLSGIIMHILGLVNYLNSNLIYENSPLKDKITQAKAIIRDRSEENLSMQLIASEIGMGYNWFRRNFKKYVGISPVQYLLRQKHLKAKELLINSKEPVSEIGFMLGFENISQFSTFFKKFEGVSASSYRINNTFRIPKD